MQIRLRQFRREHQRCRKKLFQVFRTTVCQIPVKLSLFVGERHAVLSCDPASGAYVLNTEEPILFVIGIKALSLKKNGEDLF